MRKINIKTFPYQGGSRAFPPSTGMTMGLLLGSPGAFPLLGLPRAFTLVELIVVVTILALLSTIGFVSYSSYLSGVRDTNRLSQLVAISDGLELYRTKKTLPIPDDNIEIRANGTVIGYQGYAGVNVLETIDYSKTGKDPKDKTHFSYYLTQDKKYYQLLTYLEEEENLETNNNLFQRTYADTDYTNRYPKVSGKKLGILTQSGTNIPVQEVTSLVSSGYLDIATTIDNYVARLTDEDTISGTGTNLAGTLPAASCKRLKQMGKSVGDGEYKINPTGSEEFKVYCDMSTDSGGWTLITSIEQGIVPDYAGIKNSYLNTTNYDNNGIYILNKIIKDNINSFEEFIVDYKTSNEGNSTINNGYYIKQKLGTTSLGLSLIAKTNGDTYNDLGTSEIITGITGHSYLDGKIPDDIDLFCNATPKTIEGIGTYGFRKVTNTFFGYYACNGVTGVFVARIDGSLKTQLYAKDSDTDYNAQKLRFWVR